MQHTDYKVRILWPRIGTLRGMNGTAACSRLSESPILTSEKVERCEGMLEFFSGIRAVGAKRETVCSGAQDCPVAHRSIERQKRL